MPPDLGLSWTACPGVSGGVEGGGGVGAAALEQGHLRALPHTLQRQEVSARAGTASWEESAGCGWGGGGQLWRLITSMVFIDIRNEYSVPSK